MSLSLQRNGEYLIYKIINIAIYNMIFLAQKINKKIMKLGP